jgi:hypothetical protein
MYLMIFDAFRGACTWRISKESLDSAGKVFKLPDSPLAKLWLRFWLVPKMSHFAWAQGMGRHNAEDVQQLVTDDLKAVSLILGKKKFILGETACEDDCAIFGQLVQVLWGIPGTAQENLLHGQLKISKINKTGLTSYSGPIPAAYFHFLILSTCNLSDEFPNLRDYCLRMKEEFWPDWNKHLAR